MNKFSSGVILVGVIFLGCASVEMSPPVQPPQVILERKVLTNIRSVRKGMTFQEVKAVMGEEIAIGYKSNETGFESLTIKQPYRVEIFEKNNKVYKTMYYFTEVKNANGLIEEEELTPLVFVDDILIGQGRDFVFQLSH